MSAATAPADLGVATHVLPGYPSFLSRRGPEGHPEILYAGFWVRLSVGVADLLAEGLLGAVLWWLLGFVLPSSIGDSVGGVIAIAIYNVWLVIRLRTTPVGRLFGLRIVRSDGSAVPTMRMLARTLLWLLESMLPVVSYVLNAVLMASDPLTRTLHDRVCDTVVLRPAPQWRPRPRAACEVCGEPAGDGLRCSRHGGSRGLDLDFTGLPAGTAVACVLLVLLALTGLIGGVALVFGPAPYAATIILPALVLFPAASAVSHRSAVVRRNLAMACAAIAVGCAAAALLVVSSKFAFSFLAVAAVIAAGVVAGLLTPGSQELFAPASTPAD